MSDPRHREAGASWVSALAEALSVPVDPAAAGPVETEPAATEPGAEFAEPASATAATTIAGRRSTGSRLRDLARSRLLVF